MNVGRTIFSQLIECLPNKEFQKCVDRYHGDSHLRGFSCWDQLLAMSFAQLTYRESLRDIEACLRSMSGKLYHMGLRGRVARSTLADALDSTTIDLCLSLFPWANFRKCKAAVKMHTLLDLHGNIPTFVRITDGTVHDVNILDEILPEPGAFYVMDRGYVDFERLFRF